MISHQELKLLKSGEIEFIPLPEGYRLTANEERQIFISRGGKKKYFLTDDFLKHLYSKKNINQTMTIIKTIHKIENIIKRLKKESRTRIELENLLESIKEGFN